MAGTRQPFGFTQYWVANPSDPQGNPHKSFEVRIHKNGDFGSLDVYPLERGIVGRNDGNNPDFECIVTQLKENANRPVVESGRREVSN
jgi:hypothetical protein